MTNRARKSQRGRHDDRLRRQRQLHDGRQYAIYTDNTVDVTGSLKAKKDRHCQGNLGDADHSITNAAGGGFFSGDILYAKNKLNRIGKITIADGSSLTANYGDINILNNSGVNDKITARAMIDTGGVVDLGTIETSIDIDNDTDIEIGNGVKIIDRFGTVTIRSDASIDR